MKSINFLYFITFFFVAHVSVLHATPFNPRVNTQIAAGFEHSFIIDGNEVYAWGSNRDAQLGNAAAEYSPTPTPVENLKNIIAIAQGSAAKHGLALSANGTVWAWGDNEFGQLGIENADVINFSIPKRIEGVYGVVALAVGHKHSLALEDNGTVWSWGDNADGQLGHKNQKESLIPKRIHGLTDVVSIAAGYYYSIALKSDGTVWTWGKNASGQLGIGNKENREKPTQVKGLSNIVYISAGAAHCLAVDGSGKVWSWGWNDYGQLGDGTFDNRLSPVLSKVKDIVKVSAGGLHNIALNTNGEILAWGSNAFGQLAKLRVRNYPIPVKIYNLNGAALDIAAGDMHSIAVLEDGNVFCWGSNSNGQIGTNDELNTATPYNAFRIQKNIPISFNQLNASPPSILPIVNKYVPPINVDLVENNVSIDIASNESKGNEKKVLNTEKETFGIPDDFGQASLEDCPVLDMMHTINISLACSERSDAMILRWKTALDIDNFEFIIEKSQDNKRWVEIGIAPIFKEQNRYYYFEALDYTYSGEKTYYRLKQYDCDVNYTYSVTANIDCAYNVPSNDLIDVSPELSSNNFTVIFKDGIKDGFKYEVIDVNGQAVLSEKITPSNNKQSLTINAAILRQGIYVLNVVNIKSNLPFFTKKIIKE